MGTNYYVEIPGAAEPAHLGKSSGGNPFSFYAQPQWDPRQAFSSWVLLATMGEITDEYGRTVAFADLFQRVMKSYADRRVGAMDVYIDHHEAYINHGFHFYPREFC